MLERITPAWRNGILLLLGALVLWFGWTVRAVLNPLIAAYFLAYVVHPLVLRLERRGFSRRAAVNVIFVGAFGGTLLVAGVFFIQGRGLVREIVRQDGLITTVQEKLDTFVSEHEEKFRWILDKIESEDSLDANGESASLLSEEEDMGLAEFSREILRRLTDEVAGLEGVTVSKAGMVGLDAAGSAANILASLFGSFLALATFFFLLPIYTWFLLFELGNIHGFVNRYLPRRDRDRFSRIGHQIGEVLANFFRGRLLVALLKGVYMAAFLWAIGVEYPLLIGLGSGFLSLVPFVGAFIGGVFAFGVANLTLPFGPALLWTVVIFGSAEMIEGYILIPKIIGDSLGLPPLVVLFSVFLGGAALGVFGLLLALPLTASLLILVREFVLPALANLADEA